MKNDMLSKDMHIMFPYRRTYCVYRCSGNNVNLVNESCEIIAEICIMCLLWWRGHGPSRRQVIYERDICYFSLVLRWWITTWG